MEKYRRSVENAYERKEINEGVWRWHEDDAPLHPFTSTAEALREEPADPLDHLPITQRFVSLSAAMIEVSTNRNYFTSFDTAKLREYLDAISQQVNEFIDIIYMSLQNHFENPQQLAQAFDSAWDKHIPKLRTSMFADHYINIATLLKDGVETLQKDWLCNKKQYEQYKDNPDKLAKDFFGVNTQDNIEISQGPLSVNLTTSDRDSVALFYRGPASRPIDNESIAFAGFCSTNYIPNKRSVIVQRQELASDRVLRHEQQHAFNASLKNTQTEHGFNHQIYKNNLPFLRNFEHTLSHHSAFENLRSTLRQKDKTEEKIINALHHYVNSLTRHVAPRLADELLSQCLDEQKHKSKTYVKNTMLKTKPHPYALYDYRHVSEELEKIEKLLNLRLFYDANLRKTILQEAKTALHKHYESVIKKAIDAIFLMKDKGYSDGVIATRLMFYPLSRWAQLAERLPIFSK